MELLARRMRDGTLFDASAMETAWLACSGGVARPAHLLLALTGLDVVVYWPPEARAAPDATQFLQAAVRTLVHAFSFTYEVRATDMTTEQGEPEYLHSPPWVCRIAAFFLERMLAPDYADLLRTVVQPWTVTVLANRFFGLANGADPEEGFTEGFVPLALLARDARDATTVARAQPPPPDALAAEEAHPALMADVRRRLDDIGTRSFKLDTARARRAAAQLLDLVDAPLPADSLVRCHALLQWTTVHELPFEAPHSVSTDDIWTAERASWRGEHGAAMLAASRAAAAILVRRAAAGTLFHVSADEFAMIESGIKTDRCSPFSFIAGVGINALLHWPDDVGAGAEGDAIVSHALRAAVEGTVSGYVLRACHTGARVMMPPSTGGLMQGLMRLATRPEYLSRARRFVEEKALRAAYKDITHAAAAHPLMRDPTQQMNRSLDRYRERLDARGGLRACANGECQAVEAHASQFKACSACKRAVYCGAACQKAHWRAGHKAACQARPQRAASAAGTAEGDEAE